MLHKLFAILSYFFHANNARVYTCTYVMSYMVAKRACMMHNAIVHVVIVYTQLSVCKSIFLQKVYNA